MSSGRHRVNVDIFRLAIKMFVLGTVAFILTACASPSGTGTPLPTSLPVYGTPQPPLNNRDTSTQSSSPVSPTPYHSSSGTPTSATVPAPSQTTAQTNLKTVFLIVMENHNWSDIYDNSSAPFINKSLLPQASYATQY
jgi:hypothetical protein